LVDSNLEEKVVSGGTNETDYVWESQTRGILWIIGIETGRVAQQAVEGLNVADRVRFSKLLNAGEEEGGGKDKNDLPMARVTMV